MSSSRTMITGAWALQRQQYGEQPHWMITVLACMLGQIGLPGGGLALDTVQNTVLEIQFNILSGLL